MVMNPLSLDDHNNKELPQSISPYLRVFVLTVNSYNLSATYSIHYFRILSIIINTHLGMSSSWVVSFESVL